MKEWNENDFWLHPPIFQKQVTTVKNQSKSGKIEVDET